MNLLEYLISLIKAFFRKPTGVLPPVSGGSDQVYVPNVSMDGDWEPYLSKPYESQSPYGVDELNCTSQSGINAIEAILNYYLKNDLLPKDLSDFLKNPKAGWLNKEGYVKLSTRYTAKMAGTTKQGLAMDDFWRSVNRDGIVPLSAYKDPEGQFTWEEYYKPVDAQIKAVGSKAKDLFQFTWKVIENNNWNAPSISKLKEALKESPLHIAGALCPLDYAGIQRPCGKKMYEHARLMYRIDDYIRLLDQYDYQAGNPPSYLKRLSTDYPVPCVIKIALNII